MVYSQKKHTPGDDVRDMYYRRSLRLEGYDYTTPGYYFVTICTENQKIFFGEIVQDEMKMNKAGQAVQEIWEKLPRYFPCVELDQWIIMPNHCHGIIILSETCREHLNGGCRVRCRPHLDEIVRTLKAASTRQIRTNGRKDFAWQERYYDHIVRNPSDLDRIRQYIVNNPARWAEDRFYATHSIPTSVTPPTS